MMELDAEAAVKALSNKYLSLDLLCRPAAREHSCFDILLFLIIRHENKNNFPFKIFKIWGYLPTITF